MDKPRVFLGSSGSQTQLVEALTRGLEDVAHVEPWMTSFNPGTTTPERLLELTREVDFAALVFAQDDWTRSPRRSWRPRRQVSTPTSARSIPSLSSLPRKSACSAQDPCSQRVVFGV
jgi:hypothetical protein